MGLWAEFMVCQDTAWLDLLTQGNPESVVTPCADGWQLAQWSRSAARPAFQTMTGPALHATVVDSDTAVMEGITDGSVRWRWTTDEYTVAGHDRDYEPGMVSEEADRALADLIVTWAEPFRPGLTPANLLTLINRGWIFHETAFYRLLELLGVMPAGEPDAGYDPAPAGDAAAPAAAESDQAIFVSLVASADRVLATPEGLVDWLQLAWHNVLGPVLGEYSAGPCSAIHPWEVSRYGWEPHELLAGISLHTRRGRRIEQPLSADGWALVLARAAAGDVSSLRVLLWWCDENGRAASASSGHVEAVEVGLFSPWAVNGSVRGVEPARLNVVIPDHLVTPGQQDSVKDALDQLADAAWTTFAATTRPS